MTAPSSVSLKFTLHFQFIICQLIWVLTWTLRKKEFKKVKTRSCLKSFFLLTVAKVVTMLWQDMRSDGEVASTTFSIISRPVPPRQNGHQLTLELCVSWWSGCLFFHKSIEVHFLSSLLFFRLFVYPFCIYLWIMAPYHSLLHSEDVNQKTNKNVTAVLSIQWVRNVCFSWSCSRIMIFLLVR